MQWRLQNDRSPVVAMPSLAAAEAAGPQLRIDVVFTALGPTERALRCAFRLARGLDAEIVLTMVLGMPVMLPFENVLEQCAAREAWCQELMGRSLYAVTQQAGGRRIELPLVSPSRARVHLCLCREPEAALSAALRPGSLVLIGECGGWRSLYGRRLAARLRRRGHHVLLVREELKRVAQAAPVR